MLITKLTTTSDSFSQPTTDHPCGRFATSREYVSLLENRTVDASMAKKKYLVYDLSKKSPTGPTEQTPKPEYLITLAILLGVRW